MRSGVATLLSCVALPVWAAATHDVVIENYKYAPAELTVKVGDTVRWVNREKRTSHSILFKGEGGFESDRIFPDEAWSRTFDKPGRYPYTCGPHPEMQGRIDVEAP